MGAESQKCCAMGRVWCGSLKALMENFSLSGLKSQRTEPWGVATVAKVRGASQKRESQRMAAPCSVCKLFPNTRQRVWNCACTGLTQRSLQIRLICLTWHLSYSYCLPDSCSWRLATVITSENANIDAHPRNLMESRPSQHSIYNIQDTMNIYLNEPRHD